MAMTAAQDTLPRRFWQWAGERAATTMLRQKELGIWQPCSWQQANAACQGGDTVLVKGGTYGDVVIRGSNGRFKGIARVPPDAKERALSDLDNGGVIGIRLDLIADGVDVLRHPAMPRLFAQVREHRWQLHVQC